MFSPRARGCSGHYSEAGRPLMVFPACAGMFRGVQLAVGVARCFPRVRGDVPLIGPLLDLVVEFSPRARGCSEDDQMLLTMVDVFPACAGMFPRKPKDTNQPNRFPRVRGDVPNIWPGCTLVYPVFPACAGMFRKPRCFLFDRAGFPRVRGDVPVPAATIRGPNWFSPRARGCSSGGTNGVQIGGVFPACAGMFRFAVATGRVH